MAWKREHFKGPSGQAITKGYIKFFEPDVFVEAEDGLLESLGLGTLRKNNLLHENVISLNDFLKPEDARGLSQPRFGLSVIDVLRHIYKTERKFSLRDKRPAVLVKNDRHTGVVEALFGAYPPQADTKYFQRWYNDVFAPTESPVGPDAWMKVFAEGAETPLRVTRYALEFGRQWHHEPVIFVFDPTKSIDLIDLWNLRLEPNPVVPVPVDWFNALADYLRKFIEKEHQPVQGNPHGLMHHTTIEFSRSITKDRSEKMAVDLSKGLPSGSLHIKYWRTPIWEDRSDEFMPRERRLTVVAREQRTSATIKEDGTPRVTLNTLAPEFASRYGVHGPRWVNAINLRAYGSEKYAAVLPFNTWDRSWPRLDFGGEEVGVNSEGWVFGQRYKDWTTAVVLFTKEEAIIGALKQLGIDAELSEPGHIAKQMLEHLDGIWSVHLIADLDTITLLNNMAGGVRHVTDASGTTEHTFERRSRSIKDWIDLVERRLARNPLPKFHLSDFTDKNIVRLGVESDCPHCQANNWHSLKALDYDLSCERCLNSYPFPQARLRKNNRNWHYRVVGPFSVPDYGRGSYSALLVLRALDQGLGRMHETTFATAMNFRFDSFKGEVDFVAWRRTDLHGAHPEPDLVIGEAKSIGEGDLLRAKDIEKLKTIAKKLPGAIVILAVLRDKFTSTEISLLRSFANWGRRTNELGRPTNPVILMTGNELFFEHLISATWKDFGGPYAAFADYDHTKGLYELANSTQQIYLGLPSFEAQREAYWKKRHEARRAKKGKPLLDADR